MKEYLSLVDIHTKGPRCDVTPLFGNPKAFSHLVTDLSTPFVNAAFDHVAGIDALGFILGAAIAQYLRKGFIPLRKGGKLPVAVDSVEFIDYTAQKKTLELRRGAIVPGQKILLVDEWIETSAQIRAGIEIIERQGGSVIGIAAISMDDNDNTRELRKKYKCCSAWDLV
jgi:adenine phosphoribosyltransferase